MQIQTLYEQDFYAWTVQQTELIRSGRWELLDIENLIEEIESLGKQAQRELENLLGVLLGHLLKWNYQPEARSRSWWVTIREQRRKLKVHLKENPSLKPYLAEAIEIGFQDGLDLVFKETPIPLEALPEACPFSEFEIFEKSIEWDNCWNYGEVAIKYDDMICE
jgi:hypothetical protein